MLICQKMAAGKVWEWELLFFCFNTNNFETLLCSLGDPLADILICEKNRATKPWVRFSLWKTILENWIARFQNVTAWFLRWPLSKFQVKLIHHKLHLGVNKCMWLEGQFALKKCIKLSLKSPAQCQIAYSTVPQPQLLKCQASYLWLQQW